MKISVRPKGYILSHLEGSGVKESYSKMQTTLHRG